MPKGYEEMNWLNKEGMDELVDLNTKNVSPLTDSGADLIVDEFLNLKDKEFSSENEEGNENGGVFIVKEESFEGSDIFDSEKYFGFKTEQNSVDFDSLLAIPQEEPGLEWLSQFVEESFSQFSCLNPIGITPFSVQSILKPSLESTEGLLINKSYRRNQTRTGGRIWPSPIGLSSSNPTQNRTQLKKQAKKGVDLGLSCRSPRRCSHCGVQKTPQWRSGPDGPKTLCNACGVRFKSDRLYPEYRPACSPTFSSELHSNSHRKVLEMRKKKELMITVRPENLIRQTSFKVLDSAP